MVCGFAQVVCGDTVLCETELLCANAVAADETQADTGWWERFLLWLDRIRGREIEEMQ